MSAAIMAPEQALELIERLAAQQAEDLFQLVPEAHDRAVIAQHLEESADILWRDTAGTAIESPAQEAALVALQGRAYKVEKAIDALRKRRLAPLQAEVRAINSMLGTESSPGGLLFGALLSRMGKGGDADRRQAAWRAAERARIAREASEAQARQIEAARREHEAQARVAAATDELARVAAVAEVVAASAVLMVAELAAPLPQVRGVRTEDGSKSYREEWTFEVVDPSQVPREYLMVNETAIRAAVRAGARAIPGVNVYQAERSRRGI